jgi:putative protease
MNSPVELVAPAGNLQKLKVAVAYGADAVYLSGRSLSLRAGSGNFMPEQMAEAIDYAHRKKVRAFVLLNILAHNEHVSEMHEHLESLASLKPDALVISDFGAFELARELAPDIPIHVSTQANVTNWRTARFWQRMGASRIILARELSLREITEIASRVDVGLEIFVHGAMCMAYSGRCFMSKHFVGRDSNLGDCAQPCRWTYRLTEETRPDDTIEVEETPEGTSIFSSRDLCMIEHIPEVIAAGVCALKIEGRMKSAYYVGLATRSYRQALDACHADPTGCSADPSWLNELKKTSHRDFTTGFYLGEMQNGLAPAGGADRRNTHLFVGLAIENKDDEIKIEVRGRIRKGNVVECVQPDGNDFAYAVESIIDEKGKHVDVAQPNQLVFLPGLEALPYSLLRMPQVMQ